MRFLKRTRHCLALLTFTVVGLIFGSAQLYWTLAVARLRKEEPSRVRRRVAEWQSTWGQFWYWCATVLGGLRVTYVFHPSFLEASSTEPYLWFGNHVGAHEVVINGHVMRTLRHDGVADYRPVAKAMIASLPIIGRAWGHTSGFMRRDGKKGDIDAVARLTETAVQDGAHILIYPEGTVLTEQFARERKWNRATMLDRIKHKGFRLTARGSGYKFMTSTMFYRDYDPWFLSDEGAVPPGNDLVIEYRVLPALPADGTDEDIGKMLIEEFRRKDAWLATVQ